MALDLSWTVTLSLYVTDHEIKEMADFYHFYRRQGNDHIDSLHEAVQEYLRGQDDDIYYGMDNLTANKIETALNTYLSTGEFAVVSDEDDEDPDPRCIPTIMELNP